MTRLMTVLIVLTLATACLAAGSGTKPAAAEEKAEPVVLWSDDFEAYEPTDAWTGTEGWKATVAEGVVGRFGIGEDFGKDGKGLLILNESPGLAGKRLAWMSATRLINEVKGKERFVVSLDYQVPTKEAKDTHRVDLAIGDVGKGGRGIFFIELAPWGVNHIYRDADKENTRKMLYIRAQGKPAGQWNHIEIQVDQKADRYRVLLNGKASTGPEGEWCYFRYDHDANPEYPKSISFNTADAWKGSRRFIDNITFTEPTEEWEVK